MVECLWAVAGGAALAGAVRMGEAVITAGMGMAGTATPAITLTIPGAITLGAGVTEAVTVMAGMDILGLHGDGMEALAGTATATRIPRRSIQSLSILTMGTPLPTTSR